VLICTHVKGGRRKGEGEGEHHALALGGEKKKGKYHYFCGEETGCSKRNHKEGIHSTWAKDIPLSWGGGGEGKQSPTEKTKRKGKEKEEATVFPKGRRK